MSKLDDVRKGFEGALGTLSPAKAQQLAKDLLEPGAAKEQVGKLATDLIDWSQRNRERLADFIRKEIADQLRGAGVASQAELDSVKKRVRDLERASGMTASGRSKATAKKPTARKPAAKKPAAKKATAQPPATEATGAAG